MYGYDNDTGCLDEPEDDGYDEWLEESEWYIEAFAIDEELAEALAEDRIIWIE